MEKFSAEPLFHPTQPLSLLAEPPDDVLLTESELALPFQHGNDTDHLEIVG